LYHIIARDNRREDVFNSDGDRRILGEKMRKEENTIGMMKRCEGDIKRVMSNIETCPLLLEKGLKV
jgi:hypothetical protein